MLKKQYIITIDGPAASGKSTLAKQLACNLGFSYLNSGKLYRSLACFIELNKINYTSMQALAKLFQVVKIIYEADIVKINGINYNKYITNPNFTKNLAFISQHPLVRANLTKLQQDLAVGKNVIAEGRDAGSIVFPNADLKIALTADLQKRAFRRYAQFKAQGLDIPLEETVYQIKNRDLQDTTRPLAPLIKSKDSIELDNSNLTIAQQIKFIKSLMTSQNIDK